MPVLLLLAVSPLSALANPRLPAIFGDNMVLQQKAKVPVWGWADPNERVEVEIDGQKRTAYAFRDGTWSVDFQNLKAGGPYTLTVKGNSTVTLSNVMVGEVWVCSGQSNMEYSLDNSGGPGGHQNLEPSNLPNVRLFHLQRATSTKPLDDAKGKWEPCTTQSMADFSLVGFYFARRLSQELGVPVGMIETSWGGTPAESWTRRVSLEQAPELKPMVDYYDKEAKDYPAAMEAYKRAMTQWQETHLPKDTTNKGIAAKWQIAETPDADWRDMPMPSHWEDHGLNIDGVVWLRKTFTIPEAWYGKELTLQGGTIDDYDTTYFNGVRVGGMGFDTPDAFMTPRVYKIPSYVVRKGSNTIAIRVFDTGGVGGMDPASALSISPTDEPAAAVSLAGPWKVQVEHEATPTTQEELRRMPQPPQPPDSPVAPSTLYNGMVAPIVPFGIRGAIWYQGESNASRAAQYRTLFPTMIRDWRNAWNRGPFPFYFVQLANFMQRKPEPGDSAWAELREAQTMTLSLKNTGMAVIIDVGEANNIHPRNKEAVGERLALWALARDYGKKVEFSGPLYKDSSPEKNGIRIRFDHVDGGLATMSGQDVKGFSIAGEDGKFVWANARIEGNAVFVWSDAVPKPVAVRYAWADNPECNLINKAGLPASPFRTDHWPVTTERKG